MATTMTHEATVALVEMQCPYDGCGVMYALSESYRTARRKDHKGWYCPNGHSLVFNKETEEERLRRLLDNANASNADTRARLAVERKNHASTKGKLTKTLNRA